MALGLLEVEAVPVTMRVGQAFEAAAAIEASQDAFGRFVLEDNGVLVLQGNAAASGFELVSPGRSRPMLAAAELAWRATRSLNDMFTAALRSVHTAGATDEQVVGWLTAIWIDGDRATIRWLGGDEVLLLEDGHVLSRTYAHTLARKMGGAEVPDVLVRGLGGEYAATESDEVEWALRPGHRVVVISRAISRTRTADEIARIASVGDVEAAARSLVSGMGRPYAAASVLAA